MNDFQGLLSGDYGFIPQGKSAPMAPPRSDHRTSSSAFDLDRGGPSVTTNAVRKAPYSKSSSSSVFVDDQDNLFSTTTNLGGLDDVFGGRSKSPANSPVNLDSMFVASGDSVSRYSSLPVFDKPVFDDDVSDVVSGLKNSSSANYEDIFASSSPPSKKRDAFDDLLGGLSRKEPESNGLGGSGRKNENDIPPFDDLLPGFGSSRAHSDRNPLGTTWDHESTLNGKEKATSGVEDRFVVLNSSSSDTPSTPGFYSDPLEQSSKLGGSSINSYENVSASGGLFDGIDPLGGLGKSVPMNDWQNIGNPARTGTGGSNGQTSNGLEARERSSSIRSPERVSEKNMPPEGYHESPIFNTPSASVGSHRSAPNLSSSYVNASDETIFQRHSSMMDESYLDSSDVAWLNVSEIPLFTQPTAAPSPSRPPPPKPARISKAGDGSFSPPYAEKKIDDHSSLRKSAPARGKNPFASPVNELENFAEWSWNNLDGNSDLYGDDLQRRSDAAAMKESTDRAETRFKHAKEVKGSENAKATRMKPEREDETIPDFQKRELRERQEQEHQLSEEEERKQREEEKRLHREQEERERAQRRIERERVERECVRQAVERATREARERAAAEARARAEKVAVGKVQAAARERAERAAVLKAQAAARERAAHAAEAKQRAYREKAEKDAREKAERAAKEKEAREQAAHAAEAKQRAYREKAEKDAREKAERAAKEKEARDRAAAASARANQQNNENDLENLFGIGSRASMAPRPRVNSSDPSFDSQFPNKPSESTRIPVGYTGAPSAGEFQEFEGVTEEKRRAIFEQHQRAEERAKKALDEKIQRDLEVQKEQAERHRIAETLDVEIKRWAAGKEGNLRALLSTLQYVLWPDCGWQPVSLTDLITAAAVKKVYRKATLYVHPDKVQQRGATLEQKYIAEKVFDLLKEAWNKLNSEELF